MPLWQAAVLGAVQGLSEFLPISSSGHLFVVRALFGWPDAGLDFDIALHVGTLLAVLVYFRDVWLKALTESRALVLKLALATIPAVIAGTLLKDHAETVFRRVDLVALNLIVVALLMESADRLGRRARTLETLTPGAALAVGAAQAVAIVPGVSRSGSTIAGALALGFTREAAARLSFLMSAPVTAGALLKGALDLREAGASSAQLAPMAVGALVSGLVGYAAVAGLIRFLAAKSLRVFVVYRILFGLLLLALSWGGYFSAR